MKFESIVFARNREHARFLVKNLISNFPIVAEEPYSIIEGTVKKSLAEIYEERPELIGISPEDSYIYNEFKIKNDIRKYAR